MNLKRIDFLEVIFKIVERCNINCTYCYYFNMGEDTALSRPATVDIPTTETLAKALAQGCLDMNIPVVQVVFHGGEPMMMRPELFGEVCDTMYRIIAPVAEIQFFMQTNGIVMNEHWLEVFDQYQVCVGFSIDGDREAHDRYRLSKSGKSTFDLTEKNLKRMIGLAAEKNINAPATISVMDAANDYRKVYHYLRGLGISSMSFLLPDRNVDDAKKLPGNTIAAFGQSLYEIFESWFLEDNPKVQVTHITRLLKHFEIWQPQETQDFEYIDPKRAPFKKNSQILIARTDGTVAVNDTFIPALNWYKATPAYDMRDHCLQEFLKDEIFQRIEEVNNLLPTACRGCKWRNICKGGDLENRYSEENGFDNPSVYCEAYKIYYEKVCELLVANGYPAAMLPVADEAPQQELLVIG